MKSSVLWYGLPAAFVGIVLACNHISEEDDREAIERQVMAMRDAVKRNDTAAVAELVDPSLRKSDPAWQQAQAVLFFHAHVGSGKKMPSISINGQSTRAQLTTNLRRYLGIIPHGNTIAMRKVAGVWYFTDEIHID